MPSNIQVSAYFRGQGVFAGEEVQSIITFKNVASSLENTFDTKNRPSRGWTASGDRSGQSRPGGQGSENPRLAALHSSDMKTTSRGGHKTTTSLSLPRAASRPVSRAAVPSTYSKPADSHQRSISIASLGSPAMGSEDPRRSVVPPRSWTAVNHRRSTSVLEARGRFEGDDNGERQTLDSAQVEIPIRPASPGSRSQGPGGNPNRSVSQVSNAPSTPASISRNGSRQASALQQNFRFPSSSGHGSPDVGLSSFHMGESNLRRNGQDQVAMESSTKLGTPSQTTKVLAGTSITESNRSSVEFQSLSNHSQDTLASEQASQTVRRHILPSPAARQHHRMGSIPQAKINSETLLMGYAQVNATFVLDGSLVDRTPFEEVKGKGFLGGQGGGGVVGVQTSSSANGLLGGFSLNSIGESLGGLLGGADMSSTKEMKGVASSHAIPLLSTPQALLFVDLTLLPGEEKSFLFRYSLPTGLPASYKGKTIKISYHLNVGVQGAPGDKAVQAMRRVNIPFKVFSGVNDDGEIYGHDLMQPYVILKNTAHTEPVPLGADFPKDAPRAEIEDPKAATEDFLTYVDTMLNKRRRRPSSSATLEPPRSLIKTDGKSKAKASIESAIFLGRQSSSSQQSSRFEIARNGRRVATISLERILHRLGESVTASVDLSRAQLPCYSLRCFLETTEKVNPALALRSAASILRLSRRVYHSQVENTLFAERVVFNPSIPAAATPTLLTSGVNLDWALRFEFVTTRLNSSSSEEEPAITEEVLEEVANDGRGSTMAAVQMLYCETFEVSIPITVYGETVMAESAAESTIVCSI